VSTHLERSNFLKHHCLELFIADVPVAQYFVNFTSQLVDVAITAAVDKPQ
jgi:hypothetical protein